MAWSVPRAGSERKNTRMGRRVSLDEMSLVYRARNDGLAPDRAAGFPDSVR